MKVFISRLALFTICLMLKFTATAQDTLIMTDGTQRLVKVIYSDQKEIRYQNAGKSKNPEGVVTTENVNALHFKNGSVTVFHELKPGSVLSFNDSALQARERAQAEDDALYTKYRHRYHVQLGGGIAMSALCGPMTSSGIVLVLLGVREYHNPTGKASAANNPMIVAGICMLTTAVGLATGGPFLIHHSMKYKNLTNKIRPDLALMPVVTSINNPSGASFPALGLALKF